MYSIIEIGVISFGTSFLGFYIAYIVSLIYSKRSNRQTGFILGVTGGVLISIICFELLPEAIAISGIYLPIFSMLMALLIFAYLEHRIAKLKGRTDIDIIKVANISISAGIIIGFDNFPEGFALGSVLFHNHLTEIHMLFALFLHCILDGLIILTTMKYAKLKSKDSVKFIVMTSSVIAFSAILGAYFTRVSHIIMPISVGFVSGIMLYVALGEAIPKSKAVWNGRFSTIGACIGVIIGIMLNSIKI